MTADTHFEPYTTVQQNSTILELQMSAGNRKTTLWVVRLAPLISLIIGFILFLFDNEPLYLLIFGGVTLLEIIVLSFIKSPVGVKMDSMGFLLTTVSVAGEKETYYLWHDVAYIHYRTIQTRNATLLAYEAVLHSGKKIRFLYFPNYHTKQESIPHMNDALRQVSYKEVRPRQKNV